MEPLAVANRSLTFAEFDDFVRMDGCKNVDGHKYALMLYMLAESVNARSILEIGLGWGWSGFAFAASMSQRSPAKLVSLDPHEPRAAISKPYGVEWTHCYTPSQEYRHEGGEIDLLYVDGNPHDVYQDVQRHRELVKTRGLIVIDGYGGQAPVTNAVHRLIASGMKFGIIPYSNSYSHAVCMVNR